MDWYTTVSENDKKTRSAKKKPDVNGRSYFGYDSSPWSQLTCGDGRVRRIPIPHSCTNGRRGLERHWRSDVLLTDRWPRGSWRGRRLLNRPASSPGLTGKNKTKKRNRAFYV